VHENESSVTPKTATTPPFGEEIHASKALGDTKPARESGAEDAVRDFASDPCAAGAHHGAAQRSLSPSSVRAMISARSLSAPAPLLVGAEKCHAGV
jgi:hypothetical protein